MSRVRTKDARPVLRGLGSSNAPWLPGTIAWIGRYRRMSKDYEYLPASGESMIYLAMIRLMLRRLAMIEA